jgi:hypothetical protein
MSSFLRRTTLLALTIVLCAPFAMQSSLGQLPQSKAPAAKTATDPLNRETPDGTIFGFLEAAQSGNYAIAAQYLQMSPARRQTNGEALAQKLKTEFPGTVRSSEPCHPAT